MGHPLPTCTPNLVYIVLDLLICYWFEGSPLVWGQVGVGVSGYGGTTHMCTCIYMLNMIISIANGTPIGEIHGNSLWCHIHACMCVHASLCACGHRWCTHTPTDTPQISKNSISQELIKIFQFCLKIYDLWRHPHKWMVYGLLCRLMEGGWVGSGQITKNQINLYLIKVIQFCLKIYDLWRHPHLWVMYGWLGGLMIGIMSNH